MTARLHLRLATARSAGLSHSFCLLMLAPLATLLFSLPCRGASKPHVVAYGKPISVKWLSPTEEKSFDLKVRPLVVDGRVKEYVTGTPHEITDRLFAVRRAFRVNDALPGDPSPRWQWQRGAWLLVDRLTGHIAQLNLPEFDAFLSPSNWYRDYVAYCGLSEDGKKLFAVVMQIGRRKPVWKNDMEETSVTTEPDSSCAMPTWQRSPLRVTFQTNDNRKLVFSLHTRVVDVVNDEEDSEP